MWTADLVQLSLNCETHTTQLSIKTEYMYIVFGLYFLRYHFFSSVQVWVSGALGSWSLSEGTWAHPRPLHPARCAGAHRGQLWRSLRSLHQPKGKRESMFWDNGSWEWRGEKEYYCHCISRSGWSLTTMLFQSASPKKLLTAILALVMLVQDMYMYIVYATCTCTWLHVQYMDKCTLYI